MDVINYYNKNTYGISEEKRKFENNKKTEKIWLNCEKETCMYISVQDEKENKKKTKRKK